MCRVTRPRFFTRIRMQKTSFQGSVSICPLRQARKGSLLSFRVKGGGSWKHEHALPNFQMPCDINAFYLPHTMYI
jgi:hypothetical protein